MNKQRETIYGQRRRILRGEDQREYFLGLIDSLVEWMLDSHANKDAAPEEWDREALRQAVLAQFGLDIGALAIDWDAVAPAFADRILAHLERFLPDLRRHVVTQRVFTPRDFERELAAHHGAAFSVAPTLTQSAWFRPHNKDTAIPGLYLVGAGTHPGAGVPGVINSAKATARLVLEDLGRG